LAKTEHGLATFFRPLRKAVRGGGYLLGINRYAAFIDSFLRNVNEQKSSDLPQGTIHSAGHLTGLPFVAMRWTASGVSIPATNFASQEPGTNAQSKRFAANFLTRIEAAHGQ
jgi:hypothetical protein